MPCKKILIANISHRDLKIGKKYGILTLKVKRIEQPRRLTADSES